MFLKHIKDNTQCNTHSIVWLKEWWTPPSKEWANMGASWKEASVVFWPEGTCCVCSVGAAGLNRNLLWWKFSTVRVVVWACTPFLLIPSARRCLKPHFHFCESSMSSNKFLLKLMIKHCFELFSYFAWIPSAFLKNFASALFKIQIVFSVFNFIL